MRSATSLALQPDDDHEPLRREAGRGTTVLAVLLALLAVALGGLAYWFHQRTVALERRMAALTTTVEQSSALARQAAAQASTAETSARAAAEGRQVAEAERMTAQQRADEARQQADAAQQQASVAAENAARAQAEADRIRKKAEADVNRLQSALGQIADTRRTALGLVMNLGSDYLKFEFNKADLRPGDRELLSRVAGILMTAADDYTIKVSGHTDDVGSESYNAALSLRRAEAVRDFLVKAGLPANMFTVEGSGKSRPLVAGSTDAARAKNRRVELGIVHAQIEYGR